MVRGRTLRSAQSPDAIAAHRTWPMAPHAMTFGITVSLRSDWRAPPLRPLPGLPYAAQGR